MLCDMRGLSSPTRDGALVPCGVLNTGPPGSPPFMTFKVPNKVGREGIFFYLIKVTYIKPTANVTFNEERLNFFL